MKLLPKVITTDGFIAKQVMREDDLAIYRRTKHVGGRTIEHFEVVVVRTRPESHVFGKVFPAHEHYPGSGKWGVDGFTCHDLDAAWLRVKKIRAEREEAEAAAATAAPAAASTINSVIPAVVTPVVP